MSELQERLQASLGTGFRVERELGGGGMSRVFLAEDVALNRRIVVKVLHPELAAGVSNERFRLEIQLAAALQHPHIVPVLASGEIDGLPWFSMPFVEGESLRARLTGGTPIPVRDVVAILRDVASGLAFAHGRGVVHRDVKPDNVLLAGRSAVVTDFGVAKALSSARHRSPGGTLTTVGSSLGTPAYMAPEQAAADPSTNHRADLYAFGVMAYEMLAGVPPFHGRTPQALLAAQMAERPRPVSELRPDTPASLAALVMRCLEKDPDRRPQTGDEIVAALESPGETGPVSRPKRAARLALVGLAITALVAGWWGLRSRPAAAPDGEVHAIAVLPFANSGTAEDEYFSDGMTDELTNALGKVAGLRVASRTSAFAYKDRSGVDVREIGRRLGVGAVLEGTVRREGKRLRLSAQLTSTADGLTVWSDRFERNLADVFAVQDELAGAIVAALAPRLGADAARKMAERRTTNLEAYDLYLRGRYQWHQRGEPALLRAADLFERAIARDPAYAEAHAGLADALVLLPVYGRTPADSVLPIARREAERAVALDSALPDAWTTLALVHKAAADWTGAERALERALALDPSSVAARQWYAEVLTITGRVDSAVVLIGAAARLDPASAIIAGEHGYMLALSGAGEAGIREARRGVALAPDLWIMHAFLGCTYLFAGVPGPAVPSLEQGLQLERSSTLFTGILAYAYAQTDRYADAWRVVRELEAGKDGATSPAALAVAYMAVGDTARGLDALERAAAGRDQYLLAMGLTGNWFDGVRASPRFEVIAERLRVSPSVVRSPAAS